MQALMEEFQPVALEKLSFEIDWRLIVLIDHFRIFGLSLF